MNKKLMHMTINDIIFRGVRIIFAINLDETQHTVLFF